MRIFNKDISKQDAGIKVTNAGSNESSINLPKEIADFLVGDAPGETPICVVLHKIDLLQSLSAIALLQSNKPLYLTGGGKVSNFAFNSQTFTKLYSEIDNFFGESETKEYNIICYRRPDGRIYLKALKALSPNGASFNVRDFLVEKHSFLHFSKSENSIHLRISFDMENDTKIPLNIDRSFFKSERPLQVIYYGAPGTGKSHQTDKLVEGDKQNKIHQRTTFHPDSDYSSFVGCYKPSKENGELTYKFVPQAFLKAYVAAWKNPQEPYYLIIEEINRGNCAQIFGDIFQLLDRREDGFSKYHITSDTDIEAYLRDEAFADVSADELPTIEDINTEQILSGEIMQLPSNLHIYATMNTSDQSLFPIDSAFKRRWEWEYKPIEQPKDARFCGWKIVTDDGAAYDWWNFLTEVNNRIFDTTQSEDKKMGYWFTKADAQKRITQKKFIGKVLFYLWNDIFKDYARTENTVFKVFKDAEKKETEEYTFTDFFRSEGVTDRIHRLMFTLGIKCEEWQEPFYSNGETDADYMPENPNEIVTYWTDFKQKLLEGPMQEVIGNYPIPKGPRFQTALANSAGLTNTYVLATTKLKSPNEKVTICAGFNTGKFASVKAFLNEHQNEINTKVKELTGIEPNWNENQFSTTIFVTKDGIDKDWQVENYQALYAYFTELLKEFNPNNEVAD